MECRTGGTHDRSRWGVVAVRGKEFYYDGGQGNGSKRGCMREWIVAYRGNDYGIEQVVKHESQGGKQRGETKEWGKEWRIAK